MEQRENSSEQSTRRQFLGLGVAGVASALVGGAAIAQAGTSSEDSSMIAGRVSFDRGDSLAGSTRIRFTVTKEQGEAFMRMMAQPYAGVLTEAERRVEFQRRVTQYLQVENLPIKSLSYEYGCSVTEFVNDDPELGPIGSSMVLVGECRPCLKLYTDVSVSTAVRLLSKWRVDDPAATSPGCHMSHRSEMPGVSLVDVSVVAG